MRRWTAAFWLAFLLPPLLLLGTAVVCVVVDVNRRLSGFAFLAVAVSLVCLQVSFLLTLRLLGSAGCRNDRGLVSGPAVSTPLQVDILAVGGAYVGMAHAPGRKRGQTCRDVEADVRELREHHRFDVVVTLCESHEIDCEKLRACVESHSMRWLHFPIRDKWIPSSTHAFVTQAVQPLAKLILAEDGSSSSSSSSPRVFVHCNGGKGRTGLLVAAILHALRQHKGSAGDVWQGVREMRACRKGMLKNPLQQLYLRWLCACSSGSLVRSTGASSTMTIAAVSTAI
jgi:protein-tyrosine phosphatase